MAGTTTTETVSGEEAGDEGETTKTTSSAGTLSVGEVLRLARIYAAGICEPDVEVPLQHIRFLNFRAAAAASGSGTKAKANKRARSLVLLFLKELVAQVVALKGGDAEMELRTLFMPLKQYADVAEVVRLLVKDAELEGGAKNAILAGLDEEGGFGGFGFGG